MFQLVKNERFQQTTTRSLIDDLTKLPEKLNEIGIEVIKNLQSVKFNGCANKNSNYTFNFSIKYLKISH